MVGLITGDGEEIECLGLADRRATRTAHGPRIIRIGASGDSMERVEMGGGTEGAGEQQHFPGVSA